MRIDNVEIYGLKESIRASKYPMSTNVDLLNDNITQTIKNLGSCDSGTAHDSFLKGVIVQYDLTCNHVMLPQFMRYHFHDIISSQSKMHRITKMDLTKSCGNRVRADIIDSCQEEIDKYIKMVKYNKENGVNIYNKHELQEQYETIMENLPMGLEITMRVTSNYLQMKSIRIQRHDHKMSFWREFCEWIETLPMFKELVLQK